MQAYALEGPTYIRDPVYVFSIGVMAIIFGQVMNMQAIYEGCYWQELAKNAQAKHHALKAAANVLLVISIRHLKHDMYDPPAFKVHGRTA